MAVAGAARVRVEAEDVPRSAALPPLLLFFVFRFAGSAHEPVELLLRGQARSRELERLLLRDHKVKPLLRRELRAGASAFRRRLGRSLGRSLGGPFGGPLGRYHALEPLFSR